MHKRVSLHGYTVILFYSFKTRFIIPSSASTLLLLLPPSSSAWFPLPLLHSHLSISSFSGTQCFPLFGDWLNKYIFFHFSGKYYLGGNYCFPFISLFVQGMGVGLIGAELMLMHRMRNDFQISLNCKNLNSGACSHHVSYKWTRELEVDEGNRFREGCSPRL